MKREPEIISPRVQWVVIALAWAGALLVLFGRITGLIA